MRPRSAQYPGSLVPLTTAQNKIMVALKHKFQGLAKSWIINERLGFVHLTRLAPQREGKCTVLPLMSWNSSVRGPNPTQQGFPVECPINQNSNPGTTQATFCLPNTAIPWALLAEGHNWDPSLETRDDPQHSNVSSRISTMWPWTNGSTCFGFHILIHQIQVTIPTSWNCSKN